MDMGPNSAKPTEILRFRDCELDLARRELRRAGQLVRMQPTPLRLLLYLAEHRDRTVSRDELLGAIWPDVVVGDESVTRALKEARRAVGDDGDNQSVILTQKGVGYRFVAALAVAAEPAAVVGPEAASSRRWIVAAGALSLTVGAALMFLLARPHAPLPPIRSIAVLPLENLSSEPGQDYFADGMTDLLITDLSKLPGVRVVSRTSVMQLKGMKAPIGEIAERLGVDGILEGTVAREGGRVRITTQLIDARNESHLWAESYERDLAHVLEIQREVARAVAGEIQIALTPQLAQRLGSPKPVDPRALEAYMRGFAIYTSTRVGFGSAGAAIDALSEAARIEPDWAPAYSLLSSIEGGCGLWWPRLRAKFVAQSRKAALRAEELEPGSGPASAALAQIHFDYDWDWAAAEREFRQAIELGYWPASQRVHLGQVLLATGRTQEALALSEQATAEEPLDQGIRMLWAYSLYIAGDYERTIDQTQHILDVNPDNEFAIVVQRDSYIALGKGEEAVNADHLEARVNPAVKEADVHERAFRAQGMRGIHLFWRRVWQEETFWLKAAISAVALGEKDEAFAFLERGYRERDPDMRWLVAMRQLEPLHDDPRFADLAHRMNLPMPVDDSTAMVTP